MFRRDHKQSLVLCLIFIAVPGVFFGRSNKCDSLLLDQECISGGWFPGFQASPSRRCWAQDVSIEGKDIRETEKEVAGSWPFEQWKRNEIVALSSTSYS